MAGATDFLDPQSISQFMGNGLPPVLPSLSKPQPQQNAPSVASAAMPATALPPVTAQAPSPEQKQISAIRNNLQNTDFRPATEKLWEKAGAYHKDHPGVLGRLGQIGAGILKGVDIGGEILAPNLARNIPGSFLHSSQEVAGLKKDLGAAEQQNTQAATAEKDRAEAGKAKRETELMGQPKATEEKWTVDNSLRGPAGEPVEVEQNSGQMRVAGQTEGISVYDKDSNKEVKTSFQDLMGPDKKLHKVLVNAQTGEQIRDMGETKQPGAGNDRGMTLIIPTPEGGKVVRATPGTTVPAGSQTAAGWAEQGRPTTQQRNSASRAAIVHEEMPRVIADVQRLKDQLGPVAGRWNDFMAGKVGMENQEFKQLRADLMMTASAVALAHAMGRLPENLREEFDKMINAPQQSPENIVTTLQAIDPWMQKMAAMGEGPGTVQQPAAQQEQPVYVNGVLTGYTMDGKTYSRKAQ